jgi:hypothetical protein
MKSYKYQYLDLHQIEEPITIYQYNNPAGVTKYVIYLVKTVKNSQKELDELSEKDKNTSNHHEQKEEEKKRKTAITDLQKKATNHLFKIEADIQFFEGLEEINFENKTRGQIKKFFRKLQKKYERTQKKRNKQRQTRTRPAPY